MESCYLDIPKQFTTIITFLRFIKLADNNHHNLQNHNLTKNIEKKCLPLRANSFHCIILWQIEIFWQYLKRQQQHGPQPKESQLAE